ncbi:unnamed protein product, partial [Bubo scandiacus]
IHPRLLSGMSWSNLTPALAGLILGCNPRLLQGTYPGCCNPRLLQGTYPGFLLQDPPKTPLRHVLDFWGKCLPPRSTRHSSQASPSSFRICFKDLRSQVAAPDSPRKATCVVFSP